MDAVNLHMKQTPLEDWIAEKIGKGSFPLSRQALEAYQVRKLNQTLTLVNQKSVFYQDKLDGYGQSIDSLTDWQSLPFTDADELRQNGHQMVCGSFGKITRVVTLDTSGTNGQPKRCYFSQADQELTIDFFGVGMSCLVSPEDTVLILLPWERPGSVGDLLEKGLAQQGIKSVKHGAMRDISQVHRLILNQRITALVGAPSQILALQRWGAVLNLPAPKLIRSILLTTDHVPQAVIDSLEQAWGCQVFNHYGMTEMGLGGGVDCQAHSGYHLREADLFFEVINPQTGEVLPDGQVGEIVFSTLTREGMPLIRYRTGDTGRFLTQPCPCGTCLKTMDWIRYRWKDTIQLNSGEISLADFDEVLFGLADVLDFAVTVAQKKRLTINLKVFLRKKSLTEKMILDSLETIQILGLDLKSGRVCVDLQLQFGLPPHFGSLAKRKIRFLS